MLPFSLKMLKIPIIGGSQIHTDIWMAMYSVNQAK